MTDLKARWLSLIDEYSAESEELIAEPVQLANLENEELSKEVARRQQVKIDSKSEAAETSSPLPTEELPIYEATPAEINYWHAFGCNGWLQTLLREYDLDYASANVAAYNHFKIGLDEKRHVATFAIDDTHYYAIEFNKWNSAPVNKTQAQKVWEKVSAIRIATRHFENFCGVEIERFD